MIPPEQPRDYIDTVIATVRPHRGEYNSWPQWANQLADEVEALRAERDAALARVKHLEEQRDEQIRELETEVARVEDARQAGREERDMLETARDEALRAEESFRLMLAAAGTARDKAEGRVRVLETELRSSGERLRRSEDALRQIEAMSSHGKPCPDIAREALRQ